MQLVSQSCIFDMTSFKIHTLVEMACLLVIQIDIQAVCCSLTAIFFESGAISTPTKPPNPSVLSQGGLDSTK